MILMEDDNFARLMVLADNPNYVDRWDNIRILIDEHLGLDPDLGKLLAACGWGGPSWMVLAPLYEGRPELIEY